MKIILRAIFLVALVMAPTRVVITAAETVQSTNQRLMSQTNSNLVSVRYMIDDVDAAAAFYTRHFGFQLEVDSAPAFASVVRGNLRLLLSGKSSSGRKPLADGTQPVPGGWNRIQLIVPDINVEAQRLRAAGVKFRREEILTGPGGSQIWVVDPSGNLIEIFQPKEGN